METIVLHDQWMLRELQDAPEGKLPENLSDLPGKSVLLPHTFSRDGQPCRGCGVYSRILAGNPAWKSGYLSFEAVDQCCRIWIDGTEAGHHEGGYSRFRISVPRKGCTRKKRTAFPLR